MPNAQCPMPYAQCRRVSRHGVKMKKLVEFSVGDGQTILAEIDEIESDAIKRVSRRPADKIAEQAKQTFEQAMENLEPMVKAVKTKLDDMADSADEIEVKFGVKLSGEVGALITTVGGEVNYEITLKWKKNTSA